MEILFGLVVCAIISAFIGAKKGEPGKAFFLGLLIGPIGIIIAAISTGKQQECRYCRERINIGAVVCRHCGRDQSIIYPSAQTATGRKIIIKRR